MSHKNFRRLISFALVIALGLLFTLTSDYFLTSYNLFNLLREAAFTGIIAYGMANVIVGGGIDLSAGGIISFVGMIVLRVALIPGVPGIVVLVVAIALGGLCGLFNAFVITKLHLSEFVTTLASGFVFAGLALMTTIRVNGRPVPQAIHNQSFLDFGGKIGDVYIITIVWILLGILLQFYLTKTQFWVHLCAMGSNEKAAKMSGVNSDWIKIRCFVMSGALYGIAAAMLISQQSTTTPALGNMMEFFAIASCVVGGVEMTGGKGDALSAFMGSLFMTLITNGLLKLGFSTGAQVLMQGVVMVVVINFDVLFGRISENRLKTVSGS